MFSQNKMCSKIKQHFNISCSINIIASLWIACIIKLQRNFYLQLFYLIIFNIIKIFFLIPKIKVPQSNYFRAEQLI